MRFALPNTAVKRDTVAETAAQIAAYGFNGVEYYVPQAGGLPDMATCRAARRAFESNGLVISHIEGFINPTSPNAALRQAGVDHLKALCRLAPEFGCEVVETFSGSANEGTSMQWLPETHTQPYYERCVETMRDIIQVAEAEGVTIAIDPFVMTVVKDPDTAVRLFTDVGSPNLGLGMDVANFFWPNDIDQPRQNELISECFTKLRQHIKLLHGKDLGPQLTERPTPSMPSAGQGQMDYAHFARCVVESGYGGMLSLEHLYKEEEIPSVLAYVRRFFPD